MPRESWPMADGVKHPTFPRTELPMSFGRVPAPPSAGLGVPKVATTQPPKLPPAAVAEARASTDLLFDALRIRQLRSRVALTQAAFADRFGIELRTLREWEQGKRIPAGPGNTLLRVIEADPERIAKILKG